MGGYGFVESTLKRLGCSITLEEFKNNPQIFTPELQNFFLDSLIQRNALTLSEVIKTRSGTKIDDITVTPAGILAAAHLAGPDAVKRFFKSGAVAKDANGTTILDYMREFQRCRL